MSNEPETGVEPTLNADAEWLRNAILEEDGKPFVLINRAKNVLSERDIMRAVTPRLPYGHNLEGVAGICTTIDAIDALAPELGLVIKPEQRADFGAGIPIYVQPFLSENLPPRAQGRQRIGAREAAARDALYIGVALGTERIRAFDRSNRALLASAQRPMIFEKIAPAIALDRFDNRENPKEDAYTFVENAFREGQKLLKNWVVGQSARVTMNTAFTKALFLEQDDPAAFERTEDRELQLLATLSHIHRRASAQLSAQHELSDHRLAGEWGGWSIYQTYLHAVDEGPRPEALMEAAIEADINPGPLYPTFGTYSTIFALGQRLGRLYRGHQIELLPVHMAEFAKLWAIADLRYETSEEDVAVAQLAVKAALWSMSHGKWNEVFAQHRETGLSVTLG